QVTDAGLAHLGGLTSLQTLELMECDQVTEAGLVALRRALPGCAIWALSDETDPEEPEYGDWWEDEEHGEPEAPENGGEQLQEVEAVREVEVWVRGTWFTRHVNDPAAEWVLVQETPGTVSIRPGEVYHWEPADAVTDEELAPLALLRNLTSLQ